MSLLELCHVHKRFGQRPASIVLEDVSVAIDDGELAVVWGLRGCGRSTLLRIAAGIEPPDGGTVRFDGVELSSEGRLARAGRRQLGTGVAYCQRMLRATEGVTALEHATIGPLSHWVPARRARQRALAALTRAEARHCERMRASELSSAEAVRVAIARALALQPKLIVIDDPTAGVDLADRDGILALIRSLADEGVAVLASTAESTGLSEADAAYTLGGGRLRGGAGRQPAPVIPLRAAV